jgi:hypothetical protein
MRTIDYCVRNWGAAAQNGLISSIIKDGMLHFDENSLCATKMLADCRASCCLHVRIDADRWLLCKKLGEPTVPPKPPPFDD